MKMQEAIDNLKDWVRRADRARRTIEDIKNTPESNHVKAMKIVIEAFEKQKDNRWIPVSERLPEENKSVLCWVKSTTIASGESYILGDYHNSHWFLQVYEIGCASFPVKDYKVVAWQPLPEPWKD